MSSSIFIYIKIRKSFYNQTDLKLTTRPKLYSGKMLLGHGIYPTGDSHEQRRHAWFSKSRSALTAPEIRLGLGLGSTSCRGYSGTTFNIEPDSAGLIVIATNDTNILRHQLAPLEENNTATLEIRAGEVTPTTFFRQLLRANILLYKLRLK